MPRITLDGVSNADLDREVEASAGTSSSTSGSRPDRSGSSTTSDLHKPAPDAENRSGQDPPQRAALFSSASSTDTSTPETGPSPSDQPDSSEGSAPAQEATADRTDDSDEEPQSGGPGGVAADASGSASGNEPESEPDERAEALALVEDARKAFDEKDYDRAEALLNEAEETDPSVAEAAPIAQAREAIKAAREA